MKLWLLEILACPIDHAFPLELTILRWEAAPKTDDDPSGSTDLVQKLLDGYKNGNVLPAKMETPVKIERGDDGQIYLNDFLVLKSVEFTPYLEALLAKIEELTVVQDKSEWAGQAALDLVRGEIKDKITAALVQVKETVAKGGGMGEQLDKVLEGIMNPLEFLNLFKYHVEIEDAVMVCPECKRWFPVFETIPQMLPDNIRNVEKDKEFQKTWAEKVTFPK